jgi:hypothetical protein
MAGVEGLREVAAQRWGMEKGFRDVREQAARVCFV